MSDQRPLKPLIVPIFIPNQGCPFRCIYCQQETITSQAESGLDPDFIKSRLWSAVRAPGFNPERVPEIAFYGGTFTNLPRTKMTALLEAVRPFLQEGSFKALRVSTRPDALLPDTLDLLKHYGVNTVELGVQSMDDTVLDMSQRGYLARDVVAAVSRLKQYGFKIGVQLMPGLPGDTEKRFMQTIEAVLDLQPDLARLYPTLVLQGTRLADHYQAGLYRPWELQEAVAVCAQACSRLEAQGIPVIRMGLQDSAMLHQAGRIVAGPWHPCFGFLVRSHIFHQALAPLLPLPGACKKITLRIMRNDIPLVRGYRNQGIGFIEEKTGAKISAVVADQTLGRGQVRVEEQ